MLDLLSGVAVAGEVEGGERPEGFGEAGIGEVVADPATFGGRGDEAALAEAGQMVGEVGSGGAEAIGELGGIAGAVEEVEEDPPAGRVGERGPDSTESAEVDRRCRYSHELTIHSRL